MNLLGTVFTAHTVSRASATINAAVSFSFVFLASLRWWAITTVSRPRTMASSCGLDFISTTDNKEIWTPSLLTLAFSQISRAGFACFAALRRLFSHL